jgi:hypothetical protein
MNRPKPTAKELALLDMVNDLLEQNQNMQRVIIELQIERTTRQYEDEIREASVDVSSLS